MGDGILRLEDLASDKTRIAGTLVLERLSARPMEPSPRKLAGITMIVAIILLLAAFVASLAPFVGKWPVLVQALYYLFVGVAWAVPLKPLIRWVETGSFRVPR